MPGLYEQLADPAYWQDMTRTNLAGRLALLGQMFVGNVMPEQAAIRRQLRLIDEHPVRVDYYLPGENLPTPAGNQSGVVCLKVNSRQTCIGGAATQRTFLKNVFGHVLEPDQFDDEAAAQDAGKVTDASYIASIVEQDRGQVTVVSRDTWFLRSAGRNLLGGFTTEAVRQNLGATAFWTFDGSWARPVERRGIGLRIIARPDGAQLLRPLSQGTQTIKPDFSAVTAGELAKATVSGH